MFKLAPNPFHKPSSTQKVLVVVMDGIGVSPQSLPVWSGLPDVNQIKEGDAVKSSFTPHFSQLFRQPLAGLLKAHGRAVGLPSDEDMGNSEVGHNTIGAGRIFAQGAKLVNQALESGAIFTSQTWKDVVLRDDLKNGKSSLHFCGLFSDGNVHSHINHLFAMIEKAKADGVKRVRLHILLDGRDVSPLSALEYVDKLETFIKTVSNDNFDCKSASGGGRMFVTMDRYESDWTIVERGYNAHVLGEGRAFSSLREAIETYRKEGNYLDQNLPPFVISDDKGPVGHVLDNDSFVFFNFRGDRAIQFSRAMTEENFTSFPRKRFPKTLFAGMMEYDGDLHIPPRYLITPPAISQVMTELLSHAGVRQFACSETQKFGHVTYFWNGNRSGKFVAELENYVEIPSDKSSFELRPWMKSAEIVDATIQEMHSHSFQVGRINLANGDMVGHTGNLQAAILAVGAVDLALGRLMKAAKETNTILIVTADHGNADEMYERDKKTGKTLLDERGEPRRKTSHTLSPVPFALYNTEVLQKEISLNTMIEEPGLANIAATVLELAGFIPPDSFEPSLILWKNLLGKPKSTSILQQGIELSQAAYKVGFAYSNLLETFQDVKDEVKELEQELVAQTISLDKVKDEIGDVIFSLCNLAYFLEDKVFNEPISLDSAAKSSFDKFRTRFYEMEKILAEKGKKLNPDPKDNPPLEEWMKIWKEAKKRKYR